MLSLGYADIDDDDYVSVNKCIKKYTSRTISTSTYPGRSRKHPAQPKSAITRLYPGLSSSSIEGKRHSRSEAEYTREVKREEAREEMLQLKGERGERILL